MYITSHLHWLNIIIVNNRPPIPCVYYTEQCTRNMHVHVHVHVNLVIETRPCKATNLKTAIFSQRNNICTYIHMYMYIHMSIESHEHTSVRPSVGSRVVGHHLLRRWHSVEAFRRAVQLVGWSYAGKCALETSSCRDSSSQYIVSTHCVYSVHMYVCILF